MNAARTAATRPSRRAPRSAIAAIAAVLVVSSCVAPIQPGPVPSLGSSPNAPTPIPARSAAPSASRPSPPAGASPTPLPELPPIAAPLGSFTIVCADWGSEPPPEAIDCSHAAPLGLAAIGAERAALVRRLDIGYGDPCEPGRTCPVRRADVRWVVARSADFDTLLVRVVRRADGDYDVFPPVDGRRTPPPGFEPPAMAAPDLGPEAPEELRRRQPLPSCGQELITRPDEFDVAARRCFVDGVTAWSPVELISRDLSGDGGSVTFVERFTGRGAIQHYVLSDGHWSANDCAISPIETIAAFVITAPCERRELRP